jgi:hypothetical protein
VTIPAYVTNRDVNAAQAAVDTLVDALAIQLPVAALQTARGVLAAFAADCREAGHVEGVQVGRRQLAHAVMDCLEEEGVYTTSTRKGDGL